MPRKPKAEKPQEDIARIALELYHKRLRLGELGDERSDWIEAEKIVRSPTKMRLFASQRLVPEDGKSTRQVFRFIARDAPKWLLFFLPHLGELMKILALPLVLAAATSFVTGRLQREANQNAVLKTYFDKLEELTFARNLLAETPNEGAIVLARGRTVAALRELDRSRRTQLIDFLQASNLLAIDLSKTEDLSAAPVISFRWQNLSSLDLRRVNLSRLDFQEAILNGANLKGANLESANLTEAIMDSANLEGAILDSAHLRRAILKNANLTGADLKNAKLEGAKLYGANFTGADLKNTNLTGASLGNANLTGANLEGANLTGAFLYSATLTQDQLALAKLCITTLPQDITIEPDRDCEELVVDPETGKTTTP
ncbi:MAG: pentapeptide repeat-containing protein [Nodosilinea sp. WJT8-NPBG4]|nr:pentapeptide repeat-containing protein [Nodosilinea sp. WJT8-NPBG4]